MLALASGRSRSHPIEPILREVLVLRALVIPVVLVALVVLVVLVILLVETDRPCSTSSTLRSVFSLSFKQNACVFYNETCTPSVS